MLRELLTNVVIAANNSKTPGDGLSEFHPSNDRIIGRNSPSMGTIGLCKVVSYRPRARLLTVAVLSARKILGA